MKPIYMFAVAAMVVVMTGNLWAAMDAANPGELSGNQQAGGGADAGNVSTGNTGISSGGDRPQNQSLTGSGKAGLNFTHSKTGKEYRKAGEHGLTLHDSKQISGNLNGGSKGSNTFLKNVSTNKQGMGDGSKGGFAKTAAVDTFTKQNGFSKTNSTIGSATGGAGSGKAAQ